MDVGSLGEHLPPATANSVIDDTALSDGNDAGAVGEPLVEHVDQMQSDGGASTPVADHPQILLKPTPFRPLNSHPVTSSSEDDSAIPPPDLTRRGIHIPTRTSSNSKTPSRRRFLRSSSNGTHPMPSSSMPGTPRSFSRTGSSADSVISYETTASSVPGIPLGPLQQKGPPDNLDRLSPLLEDDPKSFDLLAPDETHTSNGIYSLEARSDQLFSKEHLQAIFRDTPSLLRFTSFLSAARPNSVPVLIYYLDALKATRAINYANAVAEALEPLPDHDFTENPPRSTVNAILEDKARQAFDTLVREDLPAFITHVFIQVVSLSIQKRITGNLAPLLREASEGLAEVFCLSDPSRSDNPIIFASEEFHRTTQYGVSYAIGRNCRFLQGPRTNRNSVARLRNAVREGNEICEVFLNYRRDGSPFMNLLMMAPLLDSRGNLRYFIGAQVDISGLVKESTDLDAFQQMLAKDEAHKAQEPEEEAKDEFQELCEMFNHTELDSVRKFGGNMHREQFEEQDDASIYHRPRLLIKDPSSGDIDKADPTPVKPDGRLSGVYKHYVLLRPAPSLRILFTSPSLRVPGILQSRFLDRIGGSTRVRDSLAEALADGSRGVTAKIRWLSTASADLDDRAEEGRPRWIHCTPLLGQSGSVGVWMVVLVDEEKSSTPSRRFRQAPPVSNEIRRTKGAPYYTSFGMESSGDEMEYGTGKHAMRGSAPRNLTLDAIRRPPSAMSEQRAVRIGSNELRSTEPSIRSFALG